MHTVNNSKVDIYVTTTQIKEWNTAWNSPSDPL